MGEVLEDVALNGDALSEESERVDRVVGEVEEVDEKAVRSLRREMRRVRGIVASCLCNGVLRSTVGREMSGIGSVAYLVLIRMRSYVVQDRADTWW